MKKLRYVSVAVLGFIALGPMVQADPSTQITSPEYDPTVQYDRDGVPLAVTEGQPVKASPQEMAAYRKQQAKAAADKDWLLRAYEKQQQTRPTTDSGTVPSQGSNSNDDGAANRYAARLAGLPDIVGDDSADERPLPRTGNDQADHSAASLRPGSSSFGTRAAAIQPFGSSFLKPMITPLSAPNAAGLNNFYGSLPVAGISPDGTGTQPATHARVSVVAEDTGEHDIDTPGMIAAEKDPLADPNTSDLTLDVLPGESLDHARAHQDNADLLQLPQTLDADQFHRAQAAELSPPSPKTDAAKQTATTAPAPPKPANDNDEAVPISKYPVISPVRSPIANPYDILNR